MALDATTTIVPGTGYIYLGNADTAKPASITDPLAPGAGWANLGHTSRDNMPSLTRDGSDPTTLGSWQNSKLRQTSPDITYGITFNSIQADKTALQLYFGAGPSAMQTDGSIRIPATPVPQIKALLLILVDGSNFVPLWHPRVSLLGADAIKLDAENWFELPLKGTFLASTLIDGAIGEWAALLGAAS
ncbi:hypothetical protein [Kitasatospora cheerisanensis]|uniref:Phage tail protein n=1 Tax=Kitasatospora cheerisanensis KCTC 2395 TaxID=1348663 RepID=A0A066YU02_9ACTN|nr:hypothetical protein [Kitasatospora cheerisanensis]KDN83474.1 hypothetical protein KCH_49560 [Kitasatospora cheerisanensis KCTC 2395]